MMKANEHHDHKAQRDALLRLIALSED